MPSLLDNYKGSYATIGDAKAAMNNGTFANANPYSSPATSVPSAPTGGTPSSFSATMGMTAVQPLVNMPAPTMQKPQMPSIDVNGITQRITGDYQNQLAAQKQAIEQELAKIQQGNALAVTQNQNALQDELNKLGQQKTLNDQTAINLQNRRGGFYSGGLDYQLGNIARGTTEAIGTAQRDITARNADLWSKNSLAAAQAAENIKLLETQAPDKIRSLIQQEIDRQRGVNIQEAGITGQYNGAPTMAAQAAATAATGYYNPTGMTADQINQEIAQNSAAYANASPEQQQQLHARNIYLNGLLGKTDSTGNGDYVGGNPNGIVGYRTVAGQALDAKAQEAAYQQARDQIKDQQYQQTFDENVRQFDVKTALDTAYKQGQLTLDQYNSATQRMNANTSAANAANSARSQDRLAESDRISRLFKLWESTGKAPDGIPGVEPGTPLYDQVGSRQTDKPKNIDNKTSVDNASYYKTQILGKKGITKEQAMQYIQSNADFLNDSDYKTLLNWAQDNL